MKQFVGSLDGLNYTLWTKDGKVVTIQENRTDSMHIRTYERETKLNGLAIDEEIFSKAVIAVSKDIPENWDKLYDEICEDTYYVSMLKKTYKAYLQNFTKLKLHKKAFWD